MKVSIGRPQVWSAADGGGGRCGLRGWGVTNPSPVHARIANAAPQERDEEMTHKAHQVAKGLANERRRIAVETAHFNKALAQQQKMEAHRGKWRCAPPLQRPCALWRRLRCPASRSLSVAQRPPIRTASMVESPLHVFRGWERMEGGRGVGLLCSPLAANMALSPSLPLPSSPPASSLLYRGERLVCCEGPAEAGTPGLPPPPPGSQLLGDACPAGQCPVASEMACQASGVLNGCTHASAGRGGLPQSFA